MQPTLPSDTNSLLYCVLESVGGRRGKCFERGKGGRIPKTLANYSRLGSTARGRAREGWRNTKGGREWAIKLTSFDHFTGDVHRPEEFKAMSQKMYKRIQ